MGTKGHSMNRILKFRLPESLDARLEDAASRSARTRSDLARESLVIGLAALIKRLPGESDDDAPQAA